MRHVVYDGTVMHHRVRPRRHRFTYRVFWTLLDIDALDEMPWLLRRNRFGMFSFYDRDHGPRDGAPLRTWIETVGAQHGFELAGGRVRLLCFPRVMGYVFNPLSVWFCEDASGELVAVLYEVSNTFGEHHNYLLPVVDGTIDHTWNKRFFVSPFIDLDATYRFRLTPPGERITVASRLADRDGHLLTAALSGRARPLDTRTLLRLFVTRPLMTLKVMGGIHWEALKLWRKGAPYRSRGAPPADPVSVPQRLVA